MIPIGFVSVLLAVIVYNILSHFSRFDKLNFLQFSQILMRFDIFLVLFFPISSFFKQ